MGCRWEESPPLRRAGWGSQRVVRGHLMRSVVLFRRHTIHLVVALQARSSASSEKRPIEAPLSPHFLFSVSHARRPGIPHHLQTSYVLRLFRNGCGVRTAGAKRRARERER